MNNGINISAVEVAESNKEDLRTDAIEFIMDRMFDTDVISEQRMYVKIYTNLLAGLTMDAINYFQSKMLDMTEPSRYVCVKLYTQLLAFGCYTN